MKKFRMVAMRADAPWHDRLAAQGEAVLVIAAKTEAEVRWFFSRIDWSAWAIEPITEEQPLAPAPRVTNEQPAAPAKRGARAPQEQPA